MKNIATGALCALSIVILAACQSGAPKVAGQELVDAPCMVTQASYDHIFARHCTPGTGANQFLPQYCTQGGMQTFCRMVQTAPVQTRVVQPDGRVRYDANLGVVVGTVGEKCGRLITTSVANGEVVTEFPELAGAPGNCQ